MVVSKLRFRRPGKSGITLVIAILLIAATAYFAKQYMGGKAASSNAKNQPQTPTPSVVLHTLISEDISAAREYIGKVEAIQSVALKPQITAEVIGVHFKEGSLVKAGQLLFTLDPKAFQATVELRKADLSKAEANHTRAQKYYERLKTADKRSVSAADMDTAQSDVQQAKAAIEQAKAALKLAQIDWEHTRISAPITGKIGKAELTKGNYASPAAVLAYIVQVDPVRVSFALPDRDYFDLLQKTKETEQPPFIATLRLPNDGVYPLPGTLDFEENTIDERTGALTTRLLFPNKEGLLLPGTMVRVKTTPSQPLNRVLIPQVSVLADKDGDYTYVVDEKNTAHKRYIKLGTEIGTMQEVISGLSAGEQVVLYGLQSLHPEASVKPIEDKAKGLSGTAERKN